MSDSMDTKKITCKYEEVKNLNLNFYTTELDGREITMVSHDSLEEAILNQIKPELKTRYDFNVIKAQRDFVEVKEKKDADGNVSLENVYRDHAVVECIITDAKGRRVVSLGEVVEATLTTDIARNIPVTQASIRAFDRAAIRYFGLPGKVFSNSEIPVKGEQQASAPAKETKPVKQEAVPEEVENTAESPVEATNEDEPVQAEKATDKPKEKKADLAEIGATVFTFGKYSKKTIKEIFDLYKEGDKGAASWVKFMLDDYVARDDEKKKLIEYLRKYKQSLDKGTSAA